MTLKTHWLGSFAWKTIVCTTKVSYEIFRNGKRYKDKAWCLLPSRKKHEGTFFLKKLCMGNKLFWANLWGMFYMGTKDQIMQGCFTNAFSSHPNTVNLRIFPGHGGRSTWKWQSTELWKDLSLRLMVKSFQRSSKVQFSSRWSWPALLIYYLKS